VILHRPPDLRGRAVVADLPRRPDRRVRGLPISEYPEVVPPTVVVTAQFPGANPKVIAETVATPLEEQINGVENMLYMFSQATSDGT
jgi:multidrug efflux pump subunit AcrB